MTRVEMTPLLVVVMVVVVTAVCVGATPPQHDLMKSIQESNVVVVPHKTTTTTTTTTASGGGHSPSNTTTVTTTTASPPPPPPAVVSGPTATNNTIINITAHLGSSVFLPCITHHSMERQVSWVRRRDWHILTSGLLTYTTEGRFTMHHTEGSTKWTLAIKYIKLDDQGVYECQISTGVGVVAQVVNLTVVVPRAVIPGSGEHHVQSGSTISLTCYINNQAPARPQSPAVAAAAPQYIFWYHNSRMINHDLERGGVRVTTEKGETLKSHLTVSRATPAHSGNYTCAAANTRPASISVYVTQDSPIAAIHPYSAVNTADSLHPCIVFMFVTTWFAHLVCCH